jgi:hypothetical protein
MLREIVHVARVASRLVNQTPQRRKPMKNLTIAQLTARYIRLGYPVYEAKAKAIREITYGL